MQKLDRACRYPLSFQATDGLLGGDIRYGHLPAEEIPPPHFNNGNAKTRIHSARVYTASLILATGVAARREIGPWHLLPHTCNACCRLEGGKKLRRPSKQRTNRSRGCRVGEVQTPFEQYSIGCGHAWYVGVGRIRRHGHGRPFRILAVLERRTCRAIRCPVHDAIRRTKYTVCTE